VSNLSVNTITDASGGSTASINGLTPQASNMQPFNRIINGAMTVDQRNAGASVTPTTLYTTYTLDRWNTVYSTASKFSVQQNAGSVTPPAGFTNYLGVTSLSAYSVPSNEQYTLVQNIEGFNVADLDFGKSTAKTITLSFWVRSSLTGTFGGVVNNSGSTRCYPYSYTISTANTWTQVSITIAGDTTGTWLTTNGIGMQVLFSLGNGSIYQGTAGTWSSSAYTGATGQTSVVGTSGATFYITGVQLEAGSTASSFAHENYADTLSKCQRYYEMVITGEIPEGGNYYASFRYLTPSRFSVTKRANPTLVVTSQAGWPNGGGGTYSITGDTQQASIIGISGNALNNQLHNYIFTANAEL
jgi:hypothetical protein